jgi:hypothetical protein
LNLIGKKERKAGQKVKSIICNLAKNERAEKKEDID